MKQQVSPALIGVAIAIVVIVAGFFLFKAVNTGPQVDGTDTMPPNVKSAFMNANKGHQPPKKP